MHTNVLQVFSIAIGIIGLLGVAVTYLGKSRQESIVEALSKDNVATKSYNKTLEAENARLIAERDGYKRQYEDARELAQGSPQLSVVAGELKKFTAALGKQTAAFNRVMRQQTPKKHANVRQKGNK